MQLPGMACDPVRLSVELTWWPEDDSFGVARRLWTRPISGDRWQLEDMATSGSPIPWVALRDRWDDVTRTSFDYFTGLVTTSGEPFPR